MRSGRWWFHFMKPNVVLKGEWMMDVFGEVGLEMWSEKDTVSSRVMIRIVVIVARGRIMNFIDWYCG